MFVIEDTPGRVSFLQFASPLCFRCIKPLLYKIRGQAPCSTRLHKFKNFQVLITPIFNKLAAGLTM